MSHALHFSDDKAYLLLGAFSGIQYIPPVLGGYLADRYIGFQRAILIGGSLFALGYFLLVLPQLSVFLIGLCLLILGNGFFKPNVSSIVGTLYEKNDPRRDSGFTLFYMGINIGSLIPPLFLGRLVHSYGWRSAFLLAALGMLISIVLFLIGRKRLQGRGAVPTYSILQHRDRRKTFNLILIIGSVVTVGVNVKSCVSIHRKSQAALLS